jgi:hypothetical protein
MAVPMCPPGARGRPREGHPYPHSTPAALIHASAPNDALTSRRTTLGPAVREGGGIIHSFSRDVYFMDGTIAPPRDA